LHNEGTIQEIMGRSTEFMRLGKPAPQAACGLKVKISQGFEGGFRWKFYAAHL